MNNMDKKIELVSAITALAIEITSNSDIDIFCDFSSHVKSFSTKVILNGWNSTEYETDLYKIVYLNWKDSEKELQTILDYLKLVKEEL
jgi:hypothetical protein